MVCNAHILILRFFCLLQLRWHHHIYQKWNKFNSFGPETDVPCLHSSTNLPHFPSKQPTRHNVYVFNPSVSQRINKMLVLSSFCIIGIRVLLINDSVRLEFPTVFQLTMKQWETYYPASVNLFPWLPLRCNRAFWLMAVHGNATLLPRHLPGADERLSMVKKYYVFG